MAAHFPALDANKLLLSFLECLPLAFERAEPPPAIFPLLSPVLRQRVKLNADICEIWTASWIPFLCWDAVESEELVSIAQHDMSFDPNPDSRKLEFGELEVAQYRRLDEETLQARIRVPELSIAIYFTWCTNDPEGSEDGWRISEVKPHRSYSNTDSSLWCSTIEAAYKIFEENSAQTKPFAIIEKPSINGNGHVLESKDEENADEDSYWSRYDQGQTETPGEAVVPGQSGARNLATDADEDYYNQYDKVQPEMDADDPSEDTAAIGKSSLPGNLLVQQQKQALETAENEDIVQTRGSPSNSFVVSHLEQSAQHQSHAEVAIQQHISSSIKSLYRLTKGAGIDLADFKRLVENELACLSLMDEE